MAETAQQGSTDALRAQLAEQTEAPLTPGKTLQEKIRELGPQIEAALPVGSITSDRFIRVLFTELRKTPELFNCSEASFMGAMMTSAQLGLEIGSALGHCYLIPYKQECSLVIGYKGYITLGARAGILLEAREVRQNDRFDFSFGTNSHLDHGWKMGDQRGDVIGYYGTADFADGRGRFHVMDLSDIEKRKKRSKVRSDRGPWSTDPEAMSMKTVIRAMIPQLPLSAELGKALETDEGIIRRVGTENRVSFPDAIDMEVDQGAEIEVDETADRKRAELDAMISAIPNAMLKRDAENYLLATWDSIPNIAADQLDSVLKGMNEWLDGPSDQAPPAEAPQAPETPQTDVPTPEAAPEATEAPDTDWAEDTPVESDEDVERRIMANISGMNVAALKFWMNHYELSVTGDVKMRRLDLLPLMVTDYKNGVQAIRDLF